MKTKKGDFVEIEYTGMLKEGRIVFDTTNEKIVNEAGINQDNQEHSHAHYPPVVVCIGQSQVIKGLDNQLEEKETGEEYTIEIKPEEGFGKKSAKLLRMVPASIFLKQKIMPQPGLQVNIDGAVGTIISATGGRTIVDFNHPLSGRELIYNFRILRVVDDPKEKLEACISSMLNIPHPEISESGKEYIIKVPQLIPAEIESKIKEEINSIAGIEKEKIKFEEIKADTPEESGEETAKKEDIEQEKEKVQEKNKQKKI
ncbi:MAG TPA: peptidylprolyl isomerase [Candidatus Nanoarchaeia archaeon]|nr:peptidylprolyl isomerase [Candidatus Nanoarchaeia archaeon]